MLIRLLMVISIHLALSGCMVGPDFHSPRAPATHQYTSSFQPKKTISVKHTLAGQAQHFVVGKALPRAWWLVFRSPELNALIEKGLANSPSVISARAALEVANENLNAQIGAFYPTIGLQLAGERQRFSEASFGVNSAGTSSTASIFNLFTASFNASYTLDVFGGLRRSAEAYGAAVDFAMYEEEEAKLTLSSSIATAVLTAASLSAQIEATHALIATQQRELTIMRKQLKLGGIARGDVLTQEAQVALLKATLPPLEQNLTRTQHALVVLTGSLPSELTVPRFNLRQFHLPTQLPISMPSALVRQRPDIEAAEALLHQASAQIGVATANLYPQINLGAAFGWEGLVLSHLVSANNKIWDESATILQPIFNGGTLMAKKRAAVANFKQVYAQYQQTVLQAFQNVADTLRALEHDAQFLAAEQSSERAAFASLDLIRKQYRLGATNYLNLLTAERTYQQARLLLIQAQAERFIDTVSLFQALGGGWEGCVR